MDQKTRILLGFPEFLEILGNSVQTALGRRHLSQIRPTNKLQEILLRQQLIGEWMRFVNWGGRPSLGPIQDPFPVFEVLNDRTSVLSIADLRLLAGVLRAAKNLFSQLDPKHNSVLANRYKPDALEPFLVLIKGAIDDDGEIKDSAHPDLKKIRQQQFSSRRVLERKLEGFVRGDLARYLIDEPYVTLRDERFVVPVRSEHIQRVPGIVHGTSASGASVFIEPLSTVDENNLLRFAKAREEEIIREVLASLTTSLRAQLESVRAVMENLAEADALLACAGLCGSGKWVLPEVSETIVLSLKRARHPLLIESLGLDRVVPLSVDFSSPMQALIISGPNAGGKTVALKTIGLLALVAQAGLPVPAREARFPLHETIMADVGDHQSLLESLSTFSAHIIRLEEILSHPAKPALVLLDELGTATDPAHGSVLAIAVVEELLAGGAIVVATTHHGEVKLHALGNEAIQNASFELDSQTHQPTYRLRVGVPGESSALEMARQLGLPKRVIKRASELLEDRHLEVDRVLKRLRIELDSARTQSRNLAERRRELESEFEQLESDRAAQIEERESRLQKAIEQCLRFFEKEAKSVLRGVESQEQHRRLKKQLERERAKFRSRVQKRLSVSADLSGQASRQSEVPAFEVGDRVRHEWFSDQGVLVEVKGGEGVVDIAGKRFATSTRYLRKAEGPTSTRKLPPNVRLDVVEDFDRELNLIGMTVDEARERLDKFLDRAFVSQLHDLRVVHGFGSGRLMRAVREFLSNHPQVQQFEEDGGATRVLLHV